MTIFLVNSEKQILMCNFFILNGYSNWISFKNVENKGSLKMYNLWYIMFYQDIDILLVNFEILGVIFLFQMKIVVKFA